MKAIAIIQDEHRAITAVVEGLRHLVAEIATGRMVPDHALLGALFHYIEQFPERLHHPKEDDFLFARLRVRRPDAAPLLDEPMEGLAPIIVQELMGVIRDLLTESGMAVIVVEQHAKLALTLTRNALVLERGRVVHRSPSDALLADRALLHRLVAVS